VNGTAAVLQAPLAETEEDAPAKPSRRWRSRLLGLGSCLLVALLLGYVFPRAIGASLHDVGAALGTLSWREASVLLALWAAGILAHSFVLTGALPGLTRRRALTLNLTGSSVANVLPFGGAAGTSLNYLMIRAWGMDASAFGAFAFVTNLWVVLLKLAMPSAAVAALILADNPVSRATRWTALLATMGLAILVALVFGALASRRIAVRGAELAGVAVARLARLVRRDCEPGRVAAALVGCRDDIAVVVRARWAHLSLGMLGYGVLQAGLLYACLSVLSAQVTPAQALAGFAVDRVISLVALTPGGTGFAEAGIATALIALGGAPAPTAAAVLLYRGLTYALEIPVGGAWLGGWFLARRWSTRTPPPAEVTF
jgi:uncharacterized membrane protein YbhN (UPF0104 family)